MVLGACPRRRVWRVSNVGLGLVVVFAAVRGAVAVGAAAVVVGAVAAVPGPDSGREGRSRRGSGS